MRIRTAGIVPAALVAALLLTACADPDADPDAAGTPSPPASPITPDPDPSPPVVSPPVIPTPVMPSPVPSGREVTLTGSLMEGVTAGCRLLQTSSGDYLLLGGDIDEAALGSTITVRGYAQPDVATVCQQGTPFQVTEIVDGG